MEEYRSGGEEMWTGKEEKDCNFVLLEAVGGRYSRWARKHSDMEKNMKSAKATFFLCPCFHHHSSLRRLSWAS